MFNSTRTFLSTLRGVLPLSCALVLCVLCFPAESGGQTKLAETERKIATLVREIEGAEVGVALSDLQSGAELLINADQDFHAASTMKVPVMMEVWRQARSGGLSLDAQVMVRNNFRSIVDGTPYKLTAQDDSEPTLYGKVGRAVPLRELVRLMITESSNLATNILIEQVTPRRVMELMNSIGAKSIRVRRGVEDEKAYAKGLNNTTTARDLMIVFRRLAEGKVVSAAASDEMLAVLSAQKFREGIPAGLPAATRVAHKTGSITKIRHDAGVVFLPAREKPYVLVVLTRGIADSQRADQLIAAISRAVYEGLEK